ncbi:hypothetical protein V22_40350 [Calycomorphotria hydatis]|uniref:Uncharacterized protein n=1 Tax=Calycomorphotria hydatis TaxID=2528027 RepID=A0A517TEG8_9PLAN|nr:hypothetical protein V22_40350 [Calycomorphotria hydatis]
MSYLRTNEGLTITQGVPVVTKKLKMSIKGSDRDIKVYCARNMPDRNWT